MCNYPLLIVFIVLLTTGVGLYFIIKFLFNIDLELDLQDLKEDNDDKNFSKDPY